MEVSIIIKSGWTRWASVSDYQYIDIHLGWALTDLWVLSYYMYDMYVSANKLVSAHPRWISNIYVLLFAGLCILTPKVLRTCSSIRDRTECAFHWSLRYGVLSRQQLWPSLLFRWSMLCRSIWQIQWSPLWHTRTLGKPQKRYFFSWPAIKA